MNIEYVGRNFQVDDTVRGFAEAKLRKVTKFLDEPVEIRFILETEKHRQIADLHVTHRHGVLTAKEENNSMLDALNLVVDKVEKQARRAKSKHVDKKRRGASPVDGQGWPLDIIEKGSVGAGSRPLVIESTHLHIKPMSIEEAALELDESRQDFVVFREAETARINVLYRRKQDGHYGLITPEI